MELNIKKRIYSFDILKIISIITVFVYHIVMDMYQNHPMHNLNIIYDIIIRPNVHLGMLACAVFIMISGATIAFSRRDEKPLKFYKRRLTRVLVPFYIAYIIYFVIKIISLKNIHIFGGIEKWRFIYTIFGVDEYLNAAGIKTFSLGIGEWFLGCIILCYIAYPFLYMAHKKKTVLTFVVMTIYNIIINIYYDMLNTLMPSHFNFLCQVYNFYLGIVVADIISSSNVCSFVDGKWYKQKWILFITIPIFLFLYFFNLQINIPDNFKITVLAAIMLITFNLFEKSFENNFLLVKLISLFSFISYEFFLVHHFVIYQMDYMINYRRLGGVETLIVIVLDFLITILIAIFIKLLSAKIIKLRKY